MNNFGTKTQRYTNVNRAPAPRSLAAKQNGYVRSPSTSRVVTSTNRNATDIGPTKVHSYTTSYQPASVRRTGSCQNLIDVENNKPLLRQINEPQVTSYSKHNFPTTKTLTFSSATNNSFGKASQNSPSSNSIKPSFYNGYNNPINVSHYSPFSYSNNRDYNTSYDSNKYNNDNDNGYSRDSSDSSDSHSIKNSSTVGKNNYTGRFRGYSVSSNTGSSSTNGTVPNYHRNGDAKSYKKIETTKSINNNMSIRGLVGLANLGNTCFMNSVLQCLSNCKPLQEYCLSGKFDEDLNTNSKTHGSLVKAYADLIKSLWKSDADSYVSPDKFKRCFQKIAPTFHGASQQDSQEFLRIMLEGLHQDVNRVTVRPKPLKINEKEDERLPESELAEVYWRRYLRIDNSFIVDVFVGQLKSTLLCKQCGYRSITYDPFWDLSLPIPKNRRSNTLNDCLELFTSEEVLDGDEMPKCARCEVKRPCNKSFSIQKFPQILVIHLKRFSGDRFRSKITAFIDFPISNLDLSRFSADTCHQGRVTYNLFGVSNHSGTVHGGHYTAYCCNPYSYQWHEFNDTRVHRFSESNVCSSEAYVLFYQRN